MQSIQYVLLSVDPDALTSESVVYVALVSGLNGMHDTTVEGAL